MLSHPTSADSPGTEGTAASTAPQVVVLGRERNRVARLVAVARSRDLRAGEDALPLAPEKRSALDLLLLDGGSLNAEDRLWIRGVLGDAGEAPVVVVTDAAGVDLAAALVAEGVDDVLDWTTLTSASLARSVHLALARRRTRDAVPAPPARDTVNGTAQSAPTLTLLQECASAIMMVDPEGIVRFANPEAEQLLGVPQGSLTGAPFALEVNRNAREEIVLDGPDGRQVHAEVRMVETDNGDIPMRVVTLQDMSLRRALERHFAA